MREERIIRNRLFGAVFPFRHESAPSHTREEDGRQNAGGWWSRGQGDAVMVGLACVSGDGCFRVEKLRQGHQCLLRLVVLCLFSGCLRPILFFMLPISGKSEDLPRSLQPSLQRPEKRQDGWRTAWGDGCQVAYTRGAQCDELGEGVALQFPRVGLFCHSPFSILPTAIPLTSSAAGRCRGDGAVVQGVKVSRCSIM